MPLKFYIIFLASFLDEKNSKLQSCRSHQELQNLSSSDVVSKSYNFLKVMSCHATPSHVIAFSTLETPSKIDVAAPIHVA
jgi:hypothetical protein